MTVPVPPPPPQLMVQVPLGPLQELAKKALRKRMGTHRRALLRFMRYPTYRIFRVDPLPERKTLSFPFAECNAPKERKAQQKGSECSTAKDLESKMLFPGSGGEGYDSAGTNGNGLLNDLWCYLPYP